MIRPEALASLGRWSELGLSAVVVALGLWVASLGGLVLLPVGLALAAIGLVLGLNAWRRLRFAQPVAAPGVVELVEGQVGYLGPVVGGFASLDDLVELRLVTLQGRRMWRLKQSDGQAILIPVDAEGADRLFDAFVTLPGMDAPALVAALAPLPGAGGSALTTGTAEMRLIWRRVGKGVVSGGH